MRIQDRTGENYIVHTVWHPVGLLMVAGAWQLTMDYMLLDFGWKAFGDKYGNLSLKASTYG